MATVWHNWTNTTGTFDYWCEGTSTATTSTWVEWNPAHTEYLTPEEIAAKKRRTEAIDRARALLVESLTAEQREQYDENMEFIVYGQKTKKQYLIKDGRVGNVEELDSAGRTRRRYCAHPQMGLPDADTMLAQKLMIECNEDEFLDKANVS